jgi:hypothetical protein
MYSIKLNAKTKDSNNLPNLKNGFPAIQEVFKVQIKNRVIESFSV